LGKFDIIEIICEYTKIFNEYPVNVAKVLNKKIKNKNKYFFHVVFLYSMGFVY
jgi:hypothetical protein